jgi:hypothetical protein
MEAFAHWVGGIESALSAEREAADEMQQIEREEAGDYY